MRETFSFRLTKAMRVLTYLVENGYGFQVQIPSDAIPHCWAIMAEGVTRHAIRQYLQQHE